MYTKNERLKLRLGHLPERYKRSISGDNFYTLMSLSMIKRYGYNPLWFWKKLEDEGFEKWIGVNTPNIPDVTGALVSSLGYLATKAGAILNPSGPLVENVLTTQGSMLSTANDAVLSY